MAAGSIPQRLYLYIETDPTGLPLLQKICDILLALRQSIKQVRLVDAFVCGAFIMIFNRWYKITSTEI